MRSINQAAIVGLGIVLVGAAPLRALQSADPDFDATVASPAYSRNHPRVAIDQAHFNFHTADGRYRPLTMLLRNDGFDVVPGLGKFDARELRALRVLIVANARGGPDGAAEVSSPAFTEQECVAVRDWVRGGGSLLLIADHAPFGSAAWNLAEKFGVQMGKGYVFDLANSEDDPTTLVFSRDNDLLSDSPLILGRKDTGAVRRVVTFTGQSLSIPPGAVPLLKLGPTAYELDSAKEMDAAIEAIRKASHPQASVGGARSVAGRAQGVALTFGRGRVVVMGEAAMFSAQILKATEAGETDLRFGMNAPGNNDKQFALNIMHWLSGYLQ